MSYQNYEEMLACAKNCTLCPLHETRHNVVLFDGNPKAKMMFIGEGPGEQEDLTGKPFVGRAGQLLDKILVAAGIDRQKDTYICNIVKCRPPQNRVPTPEEANACISYLKYQIKEINPRIIVLLGSTSVAHILKLKSPKITQMHGKWYDPVNILDIEMKELLANRLIMPFYHPSYLLRNASSQPGSPKWQAWDAIREIKKMNDDLQNMA